LNGPLRVRAARYRCQQTGEQVFPADTLLDLPSGEVTVSLATRALRLATYMSFGPLQEELLIQHGVRVSDSTLDRLMQTVGGVAEGDRQAITDALKDAPEGMTRDAMVVVEAAGPLPERLYVSCDGVMYPTRYRQADPEDANRKRIVYQEMKVGTVFWQAPDGQWHKRMLSGRDDVERFGLSLWALAVRCGMLQAKEVIFISDGGVWCKTVAETYFQEARRILDWYHLSEHVWEAGQSLYGEKQTAKPWIAQCLAILKASSGIGLLRFLERSRAARSANPSAGLEALDALIRYVRPRVAITDYVDYRAMGCVIGSGMMEATCKQLVGQRLKGSGRQWHESGAVAMAALIAHRLNGTWDRFWASRPLQRAA